MTFWTNNVFYAFSIFWGGLQLCMEDFTSRTGVDWGGLNVNLSQSIITYAYPMRKLGEIRVD